MSLATYADKFSQLNVGRVAGHERPHKPVMLLALLDLFEQGVIKENRITYSPELLELFGEYFDAVRSENDQPTPINPFFYLRGDGFWHHHSTSGQDAVLRALSGPPGIKAFQAISDYVFLDDELFALLRDPVARSQLRSVLINRFFADRRAKVIALAERESAIAKYQRQLDEGGRVAEGTDILETIRDAAFSRVVRRAYDYRCAACGLRVVLEGGLYIVDAAHLIPFDRPWNRPQVAHSILPGRSTRGSARSHQTRRTIHFAPARAAILSKGHRTPMAGTAHRPCYWWRLK